MNKNKLFFLFFLLISVLTISVYADCTYLNDDSLILSVSFENTLQDYSQNYYTGTLNNLSGTPARFQTGNCGSGYCLNFTGGSSYVTYENLTLFPLGNKSICWWMDMQTIASTFGIFDEKNNWGASQGGMTMILNSGLNRFELFSSTATGSRYLEILYGSSGGDFRHFYCYVQNATSAVFYKDNVSVAVDNTVSGTEALGSYPTKFGNAGAGWGFAGQMDEINIFSRAITPEDVSALYGSGGGLACDPTPTAPVPIIQWEGLDRQNGTATNNNFTLYYNLSSAVTPVDCEFYQDSILNDTALNVSIGINSFEHIVKPGEVHNHTFQVRCNNSIGSGNSSIKTIFIDTLTPIINIYQIANGSGIDASTGLPVEIEFLNTILNKTTVQLFDENGTLVWNDTTDTAVSRYVENYTINSTYLDINTIMQLYAHVIDSVNNTNEKNYSIYIYNCPEVMENWTVQYTSCNITDGQLYYYIDDNSCDTYFNFPGDNATDVTCNYCSVSYSTEDKDCVAGDDFILVNYTYDNYATCCAVTNITADCAIPENYTRECIGIHSANDITGVVVDGVAELGIGYVNLAPLIAIISVLVLLYISIKGV